MYKVILINDGAEIPIHDEKEKLQSGSIVKSINEIDSFTFTMLPGNAGFDAINEFTSLIRVYNTNKDRYEFIGRVLYPQSEMGENGSLVKSVTCESIFGYLCDSQQTYIATKNWTVKGLLQALIDCHNSQVEEYKHFKVGTVTATDTNDNLYLGVERQNTWEAIKSNLIDKIGGELRYRVDGDVIYIDYLDKIGEEKETEIALSRNMKSITREKDPTAYITRLIPLGAKLSDETEERLDITSVNGGKNYIDDAAGIAAYGIHVGIHEWDDVTSAQILLTKARNWLAENNRVQIKYSISALDLSLLGLAIDDFIIGNSHPIKNALLGIDDRARIIKQTINVCNEVESSIDVGDNFKTLSDIQLEQKRAAEQNIATLKKTTGTLQGSVASTKQDLTNLAEKVELIEVDLDQEGIFNLLTNNGTLEGLYMVDGKLYINASYIKSGSLVADLIKSGKIVSADGKTYFDLDKSEIVSESNNYKVRVANGAVQILEESIPRFGVSCSGDSEKSEDVQTNLLVYNTNGDVQFGISYYNDSSLSGDPLRSISFDLESFDEECVIGHPVCWKNLGNIPLITHPDALMEIPIQNGGTFENENTNKSDKVRALKELGAASLIRLDRMPNNHHADDYTTPGRYHIVDAEHAKTIGGIPYQSGSSILEISEGAYDGSVIQKQIVTASEHIPVYTRRYNGTEWSDWETPLKSVNGKTATGTAAAITLEPKDIATVTTGTLTIDSIARNSTYTLRKNPFANVCFFRMYFENASALTADTAYVVGTLGDGFVPSYAHALSCFSSKDVVAMVNANGEIRIRPKEAIGTGYSIYIAGFWFI